MARTGGTAREAPWMGTDARVAGERPGRSRFAVPRVGGR